MLFVFLAGLFVISNKKNLFFLIDAMLISALAVEGYLLAFQFFAITKLCSFCLIILILICLIALIYLLSYRRPQICFGFIALVSVLLITYLASPPLISHLDKIASGHYVKGKPNIKWYLFTQKNCPHCREVLHYCLYEYKGDLDLYVCSVEKCAFLFKNLGINVVPTLLIAGKTKKQILIGKRCIMETIGKKTEIFPEIFPFTSPEGVCGIDEPCP
jgi:hypothetical protein